MAKVAEGWVTIEQVACWDNLRRAHLKARRGKVRRSRDAARFDLQWETEIVALERLLLQGAWSPGVYREFTVHEAKPRLIRASPYRDRVVHQALMQLLEPQFEKRFIYDTYACRQGKGTHAAIDRAEMFMKSSAFFLHLDIVRYFPSISHWRLKKQLGSLRCDHRVSALLHSIIDHDGEEPSDDLVEVASRSGLPIGSLTSQWLANTYLSPLDHWIKEKLQVRRYVRYMDDMVLFADSKRELETWRNEIRNYLDGVLDLTFHENRAFVRPRRVGLSFLGVQLFGAKRRLLAPSGYRFRRRLKVCLREIRAGRRPATEWNARIFSWSGHASNGGGLALCSSIVREVTDGRFPGARTA